MRKGFDYKRPAFEYKFRWLNNARDETDATKYASDLTQLAWEGWCAALDLADKEYKVKMKQRQMG